MERSERERLNKAEGLFDKLMEPHLLEDAHGREVWEVQELDMGGLRDEICRALLALPPPAAEEARDCTPSPEWRARLYATRLEKVREALVQWRRGLKCPDRQSDKGAHVFAQHLSDALSADIPTEAEQEQDGPCRHRWHENPGLITPCPACNEGAEQEPRCELCGYTEQDAAHHGDHCLCENKQPPWAKQEQEGQDA